MLRREATISLDGTWDFVPGHLKSDNVHAHIFDDATIPWQEIEVPYFWNGSRWMSVVGEDYYRNGYYKDGRVPPFRDHKGVGWYRRRFVLPQEWRGLRIHLRFLAVAAKARVWVNGVEAGGHLGAYSAFSFDITEYIRFDRDNTVVVQVWGKNCFYPDDQRTYDHGGIHLFVPGRALETAIGETKDNAGIGQPVEIYATGQAYLEDLDVRSMTDSLVMKLYLVRRHVEPVTLTVGARLVEEQTGRVIREESRATRLPEERSMMTFVWRDLEVEMWSPETPSLYRLEVGIKRSGERWGTAFKDIGFKTFVIRAGQFQLNGKPYFLRAAGPPASPLVVNDRDYIARFLAVCKSLNLNCLRFHTEPPSQAWLDGCDAAGLLVIFEGPLMQQAPEIVNTREEYRALVRQAKHHPCLALYCLSNETEFLPEMARMAGYDSMAVYLQDLRQAVLEEDDSLPVYHNSGYSEEAEGGDVRDWHYYGGWYNGAVYAFEALLRGQALMEALAPGEGEPLAPGGLVDERCRKMARDPQKPLILTEFLAAYTADDGHLFQYPLKIRRIGGHPDEDNRRSLWYQAFLLKESVEILRRARDSRNNLCGISPFALFNWFFHPLEKNGMQLKPAAEALRRAMEPVHVSLRCWRRHLFAGSRLAAEAHLINDDPTREEISAGRLAWVLADPSGAAIAEGLVSVPSVPYYGIESVPVELELPDISAPGLIEAVLSVRWLADERTLSENTLELLLAPSALREERIPGSGAAVFLLDAAGAAAPALALMGIACDRVDRVPDAVPEETLLIVGPDSLRLLTPADKTALNGIARQGSTILVLEQDVYRPDRDEMAIDWLDGTPLRIMREDLDVDDFAQVREPSHPIFAGLRPEHFRMWNGNTVIISSYIRQGTEEDQVPAKTIFGSRAGYGVKKRTNVRTLVECHNFLRNDGLVEVPLGAGKVILSQLEAVRRYGDDPAATVYLRNLVRYALGMGDGAGVGENRRAGEEGKRRRGGKGSGR